MATLRCRAYFPQFLLSLVVKEVKSFSPTTILVMGCSYFFFTQRLQNCYTIKRRCLLIISQYRPSRILHNSVLLKGRKIWKHIRIIHIFIRFSKKKVYFEHLLWKRKVIFLCYIEAKFCRNMVFRIFREFKCLIFVGLYV